MEGRPPRRTTLPGPPGSSQWPRGSDPTRVNVYPPGCRGKPREWSPPGRLEAQDTTAPWGVRSDAAAPHWAPLRERWRRTRRLQLPPGVQPGSNFTVRRGPSPRGPNPLQRLARRHERLDRSAREILRPDPAHPTRVVDDASRSLSSTPSETITIPASSRLFGTWSRTLGRLRCPRSRMRSSSRFSIRSMRCVDPLSYCSSMRR
jgi:hypothetical protein